ncbi:TauD/TfdA family dioxygenase [Burkholderia gladioli]|uniref:TauD/TfdA family dioxygenase n=1 Tax=Burkholderia gladioli TaxID=28095 RepID=UPI00163F33CB|nr:TauD/TfdA family dioxygenase [Burkholderia gladioli]MBJ9679623.1 TauD/TfdA family dioxygenase [Burkholderia gladioli]MDN7465924.1 TauD/TfdA family dioxygenase [Burkholderia gladioli]
MPSRVLPVLWEKDRCPLPSLDLTSPALPADTLARFGEQLAETGAILLRGFEVASTEALARAVAALGGKPMPYVEGNSPRTKLDAGEVYTSTEHPPEAFISMHNELSYSASWPNRLYFCCVTPAASGGHTLLASSAAILAGLDAAVRDEFEARGVLYIRNLHGGRGMQLGPSWQDSFETTERAEVEAHCTRHRIEFDWRADGALRLLARRPASIRHPLTGQRVWFNQADQFHPSTNSADVHEALLEVFGDDPFAFPQHAAFGDGGPIPDATLAHIREVSERHTQRFDWQRGDCLVIDNLLVSHGRSPFTGQRKVLVAMSL